MPQLDAHWWWLVAAVVLAIAEIVPPGILLIWLAAAAGLTGFLVWLFGAVQPSIGVHRVVFVVMAFCYIVLCRRLIRPIPGVCADPLLQHRASRPVCGLGAVDEHNRG